MAPQIPGFCISADPAGPDAELKLVYIDPATGADLGETGETSGLMNWLADLHFRLLGGTTGMLVNGDRGWSFVHALCFTGLLIWWPGRRPVRSALTIHIGVRWLRLNWDIHNVFGFWSAIPLGIEAFTGAYYCFFVPMAAALVIPAWRQRTSLAGDVCAATIDSRSPGERLARD